MCGANVWVLVIELQSTATAVGHVVTLRSLQTLATRGPRRDACTPARAHGTATVVTHLLPSFGANGRACCRCGGGVRGAARRAARLRPARVLRQAAKPAPAGRRAAKPPPTAPQGCAAPLPAPVKVVGCGSCGVDYLASVAAYPKPDEKLRTDTLEVRQLL